MQYHFILEKIEEEVIDLWYCPTKYVVAHVLTKALGKARHEMLSKAMELKTVDILQSGSVEDRWHSLSIDDIKSDSWNRSSSFDEKVVWCQRFIKHVLQALLVPYALLSMAAMLLLDAIDTVVKAAQKWNVYICNFVTTIHEFGFSVFKLYTN